MDEMYPNRIHSLNSVCPERSRKSGTGSERSLKLGSTEGRVGLSPDEGDSDAHRDLQERESEF